MRVLLKKPGQFAVGSATQSGAGLLDLNFLNSDATLSNTITHSRAGNATMVASDGLIKWAPHNLLTYSEDFTNAAWAKNGVTVTANSTIAPDGTTTADTVTHAGASGEIFQNNSIGATTVAYSFFANYDDVQWIRPVVGSSFNNVAVWFDIQNGVLGANSAAGSATYVSSSITSVGNNWYRCVIVATLTSASGNYVQVNSASADGSNTRVAGSFILWGAHLYRSDLGGMAPVPAGERSFPSASTYVPTTSAARYLPRVGHHVYNGSAWVNEGVLAESEARTNLFEESNAFDDAYWTKLRCSITSNAIASPDGNTTAAKLTEDSTASSTHIFLPASDIAAAAGAYTASIYLKEGERRYAGLQICVDRISVNRRYSVLMDLRDGSFVDDESSGTPSGTNYTIVNAGDGWWRLSVTSTHTTGDISVFVFMNDDATPSWSSGNPPYNGDGTSGIYIYGAQLEAGSTPSSYIPTAGSTVTRAAETFTIPAANLPYSSVAMSIQMNGRLTYADEGSAGQVTYAQWEDDTNNRITLSLDTDSTATGEVNFTQVEGGTADTVASSATEYSPGILVPFNIASRHGMTFINGAVDGVALTANTTPTNLPDLSATDLDLAYDYMGTVERFRVWGLDLGDDGIENATTGEPASYVIWDQANDDYVQRIFQ